MVSSLDRGLTRGDPGVGVGGWVGEGPTWAGGRRGQDGRVSSASPPTPQGQDGDTSHLLTLQQARPQLCWELRPRVQA